MPPNASDLIKQYKREKNSAERNNFNTLVQTAAEWCNPPADNITKLSTPGERKLTSRMIDVGIRARRMCTAGLMSHMFPQGKNWIRVVPMNRALLDDDKVSRAVASATKTFSSAIEESNFAEEMGSAVDSITYAGTTSIYCEADPKTIISWRAHYYSSFYISENSKGIVDTYIRDFTLTARQALQEFGEDTPAKIKDDAGNPSRSDKKYTFVHFVMPRTREVEIGSVDKLKKPIASYYVCLQITDSLVKESGYDEMPYAVGRFYRNNYEKYGRSCAMEVHATFPMVNSMEATRMRAAERVSNPPWTAPNDGSTRRISNEQGSVIYFDPNQPNSKPSQVDVKDNVIVNDAMIEKKEQEILDAFYVNLFNPLLEKKNMTLGETQERLALSAQFLTPAVNRLNRYFVNTALDRAFGIMLRGDYFPELDIPELDGETLSFELVGKASIASRQIELYGTLAAIEQSQSIAEFDPSVMDNWNLDETIRLIQEVNLTPISLQKSEDDVIEIRAARAEAEQARATADAAAQAAELYNKTGKAPEEGSGAEALMNLGEQ